MPAEQYEIRLYTSDLLSQVIDLMGFLWGENRKSNLDYFTWKHIDNPYIKHPFGMVALHQSKVVGFRAYFATKWQICQRNTEFILLIPGDTVVHPDHRRQGLSFALGNKAMEEYGSDYKLFLNLSSSQNSLPGYLKMDFYPLVPKNPIVLYQKRNLLKDLIPSGIKEKIKRSKLSKRMLDRPELNPEPGSKKGAAGLTRQDNIIVSEIPRPEEMNNIIMNQDLNDNKIRLVQDEEFFQWRFLNKRSKYIFFYFNKDNAITGYLVVGFCPPISNQGILLDYAEIDGLALERLFQFILETKPFESLSIPFFGLNDSLMRVLNRAGWNQGILSQSRGKIEKDKEYLLVRPVKKTLAEKDWFTEGLDVKDFENWEIKPLCHDGI